MLARIATFANMMSGEGDKKKPPHRSLPMSNRVGDAEAQRLDGSDFMPNEAVSNPMASQSPRTSDDEDDSALGEGDPIKPSRMKLQEKWEEMFQRLSEYRDKHGNCLVPNRYAVDPQLGSWVSTQRRHYKVLMAGTGESTPMTTHRVQRLEALGFKWSTKDPRHVPWEQRYGELVEFKEKYGHAQVPIGWEDNVQLSNWVSTQRQEYKLIQRGRQSRLTKNRIALLDSVDFVWEAQRGGPRRKRKASVVRAPHKSTNDLDTLTRTKKEALLQSKRHASTEREIREMKDAEPAAPIEVSSSALDSLGSMQMLPSHVQSTGHWQVLSHGAFQQAQAVPSLAPAGVNQQLFPIASQWPVGPAGFQLGVMPLWANVPPPVQLSPSGELVGRRPTANNGLFSQKPAGMTTAGEDGAKRPTPGFAAHSARASLDPMPASVAAARPHRRDDDDDDDDEDFFDPES